MRNFFNVDIHALAASSMWQAPPKQKILAGLLAVFGIALLVFLFLLLEGFVPLGFVFSLFVFGLLVMALFGIAEALLDPRLALLSLIAVTAVAVVLFGIVYPPALLGVAVLVAALVFGFRGALDEKEYSTDFRPFRIFRRGFGKVFLGLSFFLAILFYGLVVGEALEGPITVSADKYHDAFQPVEGLVGAITPAYEQGMTLGDLEDAFLLEIFEDATFGRLANIIPEDFQESTLEEVSLAFINENVSSTIERYRSVAPLFLIVGLFFVFEFLSFPFRWLTLLIAVLAIKTMMFYNMVTIKERQVTKKEATLA